MSRGSKKGGLSTIAMVGIWALIIGGVVLAAMQLSGIADMETGLTTFREKSKYLSECIPAWNCDMTVIFDDGGKGGQIGGADNDAGEEVGNSVIKLPDRVDGGLNLDGILISRETKGYRGPAHGEPYVNDAGRVNKGSALLMLAELEVVSDEDDANKDVGYSRREWKHWTGTEGRGCWNTREEILHRDATPDTVKYVNKDKLPTEEYEEACAIGIPSEDKDGKIVVDADNSGRWIGPYNGKEIKNARTIDIDHVIPLSNAARNNGQEFDAERKEEFANDPLNLLATSAKENRTKGDKGPGAYMPKYKPYHCPYAKNYITVAYKYELSITETDYEVLAEAVEACHH